MELSGHDERFCADLLLTITPSAFGPKRQETKRSRVTEAKPSTRKNPHMSVMVVNRGPLATAGSNPNLFNSRGTRPPMETANTVLRNKAAPTTKPKNGLPSKMVATIPINNPSAAQVPLPFLRHARSQVARARATVFGLAFGGQAETLLGAFVGFLLGHLAVPMTLDLALKFWLLNLQTDVNPTVYAFA